MTEKTKQRQEDQKLIDELFKRPIPAYAVDYGTRGSYTRKG